MRGSLVGGLRRSAPPGAGCARVYPVGAILTDAAPFADVDHALATPCARSTPRDGAPLAVRVEPSLETCAVPVEGPQLHADEGSRFVCFAFVTAGGDEVLMLGGTIVPRSTECAHASRLGACTSRGPPIPARRRGAHGIPDGRDSRRAKRRRATRPCGASDGVILGERSGAPCPDLRGGAAPIPWWRRRAPPLPPHVTSPNRLERTSPSVATDQWA